MFANGLVVVEPAFLALGIDVFQAEVVALDELEILVDQIDKLAARCLCL